MSEHTETVDSIIRSNVLWSMGAGLIPVPLIDTVAVTAIQADMIRELCRVYGEDFSAKQAKAWISALAGGILARLGANVLKLIPGIGSIIGGVSMSVMAGASTYAMGRVVSRHFQRGGTSLDFNPEDFQDFFKEEFEKGKRYAENLKREEEKKKGSGASASGANPSEDDVLRKIQELNRMKEQGLLSEEEYTRLKEKLLNQI